MAVDHAKKIGFEGPFYIELSQESLQPTNTILTQQLA